MTAPGPARSRARRLAALVCLVEALVLGGFGVFYLVEFALGEGSDPMRVLTAGLLILLFAAGTGLLARLWLGQSQWPATPTVVWHVLLVPVGGRNTLNAAQAAEVISLIEPTYVVPMHYGTEQYPSELDGVDKFLKEMGVSAPSVMDELRVSRSSLPEETQIVLLSYS